MKRFAFLIPLVVVSLSNLFSVHAQELTPTPQCMDITGGQVCFFEDQGVATETAALIDTETPTLLPTGTAIQTMTMTATSLPTATLTPVPAPTSTQTARIAFQDRMVMFQDGDALSISYPNNIKDSVWRFQGRSLTSTTYQWWINKFAGVHVVYALARVTWSPMSANTKVRIVYFDNGPANIQSLAEFNNSLNNCSGAACTNNVYNNVVDVTAVMQGVFNSSAFTNLGVQLAGDGTYTPSLYSAWIDVVYSN